MYGGVGGKWRIVGPKREPMKIVILSRNAQLYATRRLVEAATERGHEVEVIDFLRCILSIASKNPTVRALERLPVRLSARPTRKKDAP